MTTSQTRSTASIRSTLERHFDGQVLTPGDQAYDVRRLGWNRTIDSRPAAVAVATHAHDVATAVRAAPTTTSGWRSRPPGTAASRMSTAPCCSAPPR